MKQKKVLITGSSGLVGSESVKFYAKKGFKVIGVDNNLREYFFGKDGSTEWNKKELKKKFNNFSIRNIDIRDYPKIEKLFKTEGPFDLIIHAASQPAHDWAVKEPLTDFGVNANGTLNMLHAYKQYSPTAVFIHCSTSKVYGDRPNTLPLKEKKKRYDLVSNHKYFQGITEDFSIDHSLHSLFGASKVAGDIVAQEFGRYFKLPIAIFRPVCISGPAHSGAELHGFLAYLAKCVATNREYNVFGYKGKQVRGNIHSYDLVRAFDEVFKKPKKMGEAYNIDGGRDGSVSILEAVEMMEAFLNKKANLKFVDQARIGDHIWCIFSNKKFETDYPNWRPTYTAERLIEDICKNGHFAI